MSEMWLMTGIFSLVTLFISMKVWNRYAIDQNEKWSIGEFTIIGIILFVSGPFSVILIVLVILVYSLKIMFQKIRAEKFFKKKL